MKFITNFLITTFFLFSVFSSAYSLSQDMSTYTLAVSHKTFNTLIQIFNSRYIGFDMDLRGKSSKEFIKEFDRLAKDGDFGRKSLLVFLDYICKNYDFEVINTYEKFSEDIIVVNFWDNIAGIFGINMGDDIERAKEAKRILSKLVEYEDQEKQLQIVGDIAKGFQSFLASGEGRFAPLALTILNMFNNRNIFDIECLQEISSEQEDLAKIRKYLQTNLFYFLSENCSDVKESSFKPKLMLEKPLRELERSFKWADFGSAAKAEGSPTLNFLKRFFKEFFGKDEFEFYGNDIFFPYYKYEAGEFVRIFEGMNKGKKRKQGTEEEEEEEEDPEAKDFVVHDDGITYFNANKEKYDVSSLKFDIEETFDFISVCKTFHHFGRRKGNRIERVLARAVKWEDEFGREIEPKANLIEAQQIAMENLLKSLNVGGYLFLELVFYTRNLEIDKNDNNFIIIRRKESNVYQIYSKTIPYKVDYYEDYSSEEDYFLQGRKKSDCKGVLEAYPIFRQDTEIKKQLEKLVKQAYVLVQSYQKRDYSAGVSRFKASEAVKRKESLTKIFEEYLSNVPFDEKLRQEVLNKIMVLEKLINVKEKYTNLEFFRHVVTMEDKLIIGATKDIIEIFVQVLDDVELNLDFLEKYTKEDIEQSLIEIEKICKSA
jgi:hypothetical protein